MELLERALEKALRVRTGTGSSKKASKKQSAPRKEPGTTAVTSKEGRQASAASKGNQMTTRSTSKSASLDRKEHKKPGMSVSSTLGSKPSASYNPGQCKTAIQITRTVLSLQVELCIDRQQQGNQSRLSQRLALLIRVNYTPQPSTLKTRLLEATC